MCAVNVDFGFLNKFLSSKFATKLCFHFADVILVSKERYNNVKKRITRFISLPQ